MRARDAAGDRSIVSSMVVVTGSTTTPPPTPTCRVTYAVTSQWQGGFVASVTIANVGATPVNGWTLGFSFGGDQRITRETAMASIRKEVVIQAPLDEVWDALRDWGALHERLVPGFATDTKLDGQVRVVTFFTGAVIRELLVDCDDEGRRLVWSIVDGPYTHHNAAAQVIPAGGGAVRFIWTADLLPDETAERTGQMMERGIATIKKTLEAH